uniref:Putative DNA-binding response regulator CreB n=1 Tax=Angiostrongylus cantonensis TaxID=6313 RepID=C7BVU1_ANGCA|nr:putative DNA-binding response regulator CreB [Angiostrongylus cantonensis]
MLLSSAVVLVLLLSVSQVTVANPPEHLTIPDDEGGVDDYEALGLPKNVVEDIKKILQKMWPWK